MEYLDIKRKIKKGIVNLIVTNDEQVILTKCSNDLKNESDTEVTVAWAIFSKDAVVQKYKKKFEIDP